MECDINPDFPDGRHFIIRWIDNSTFETEFVIEFSSNGGSTWMTLDVVNSGGPTDTGTLVAYFAPQTFLPGTTYTFRVKGRDLGSGLETAWSSPSSGCTTAADLLMADACLAGQLYFQGRTDHGGWPVLMDGLPITETARDGSFEVCGLPEGSHTVAAGGGCYLEAVAPEVEVVPDGTVKLPFVRMLGGDVTGDGRIGLDDLVGVGAGLGESGAGTMPADCNGDGAVNLFDLVLVGTNYGTDGPVAWTDAPAPSSEASETPFAALPTKTFGPADGTVVELVQRPLDAGGSTASLLQTDQRIAVDVVARHVDRLYGAEVGLRYDPTALRVVDASSRPGVQLLPGEAWGGDEGSYVAVNEAGSRGREVRFAVSRSRPAMALQGEIVIATVIFESIGEGIADAVALSRVELRDAESRSIGARWRGVDVTGRWTIVAPYVSR